MLALAERRNLTGRIFPSDNGAAQLWTPYASSPQERACASPADIIGYGGQAGGGKTDLMLGLSLTQHRNTIIFRRESPQLRGIIERSRELIGNRGRFNSVTGFWRLNDGRTIELSSCQHEHNVNNFKGRPHDLKAFDEATEFTEFQVRFLLGWLRTTVPGQRCRAVLTFNPPTTAEGQWIIPFFAPWIDATHPRPALPGELRWYTMVDGEERECPDGTPFEHNGETLYPRSRTFFPAALADNPILAATGYGATLQALPEPLRSQVLYGDFSAGVKDDAWQLIPTAWVKAAQARWVAQPWTDDRPPLTCLGLDVAHGGADKTVIAPRTDNWFGRLLSYAGKETPNGASAAALTMKAWEQGAYINVDAIGYGASACERLKEDHGIRDANAVNFAAASGHRDRSRKFKMRNVRAEAYWRLREALDPETGVDLMLPPDPELLSDLTAPRYEIGPAGIKIEDKDEIAKRLKRSPDKGDAVALAMLPNGLNVIRAY